MCQVPKIQFADLLELVVRTGALDVDYLRPKKQPPADGLGRGRVTEYEVLQDAIKSELLYRRQGFGGAERVPGLWRVPGVCVSTRVALALPRGGDARRRGWPTTIRGLDHWIEALCDTLYFEDSHAELRARYVRGALPPTPQESSRPQPQLLAQASAVSVAAKLASKMRGRKSSIDSWAFAPPEDEYDEEEDDEEEEAAPEKPAAPPPRKAAKKQTKKKHAYQTNPARCRPGRSGRRAERKPRRKKERDGPATFEGFFVEGGEDLPHSPIRTPNRPSLDGLPASQDPRTPGGGMKEEYLEDEEEDEEEYEEEYDSQPLTAAADPRTPGGGLKTLSEEEFEDDDDDGGAVPDAGEAHHGGGGPADARRRLAERDGARGSHEEVVHPTITCSGAS